MFIEKLKSNEVFVFGSNSSGFHGAGAAGLAFRGDTSKNWRDCPIFIEAYNSPSGSPLRIGKWAILGKAEGFQEGKEGKSYAIVTIIRPGMRQSISLDQIKSQLLTLSKFAKNNPQYSFLCSKIGCGLAGYTDIDIHSVWPNMPSNVSNPFSYLD